MNIRDAVKKGRATCGPIRKQYDPNTGMERFGFDYDSGVGWFTAFSPRRADASEDRFTRIVTVALEHLGVPTQTGPTGEFASPAYDLASAYVRGAYVRGVRVSPEALTKEALSQWTEECK